MAEYQHGPCGVSAAISPDNTAVDNWHDGTSVGGMWTNYQNDLIVDDHLVTDGRWPEEAQQIMKDAGIEPEAEPVAYGDTRPGAGETAKDGPELSR